MPAWAVRTYSLGCQSYSNGISPPAGERFGRFGKLTLSSTAISHTSGGPHASTPAPSPQTPGPTLRSLTDESRSLALPAASPHRPVSSAIPYREYPGAAGWVTTASTSRYPSSPHGTSTGQRPCTETDPNRRSRDSAGCRHSGRRNAGNRDPEGRQPTGRTPSGQDSRPILSNLGRLEFKSRQASRRPRSQADNRSATAHRSLAGQQ